MKNNDLFSDLEIKILRAIIRVGDHADALVIGENISEATGATVAFGNLFVSLSSLQERKLIAARQEKPDNSVKRVKTYYTIENAGRQAVLAYDNNQSVPAAGELNPAFN